MSGDAASPAASTIVELQGITKRFGAVQALDGIDFDVAPGEIHALVGENGAGKSTLLKIMFGAQAADRGEVIFDGRRGVITSPRTAQQAGMAMIAQELSLVPEFSIAANIALGSEPLNGPLLDRRRMNRQAVEALAAVGVGGLDVRQRVRDLSIAQRQLVEVARAVHRAARVVVMDEPTSSLAAREADELLHVVRRLARAGAGVVYVSHRLAEVTALANRVTVLRDGRVVAVTTPAESDTADIAGLMVGREMDDVAHRPVIAKDAPTALAVRDLGRDGVVGPVSFDVRAGEIVGIAGLVGAGRTELARLLFGADQADSGHIVVAGTKLRPTSPRAAMRAGLALIPEERKDHGLVLGRTVMSNMTLPVLRETTRAGVLLDQRRRRSWARRLVDTVALRPPNVDTLVGNLSGGNQQKVVIAKWLATDAKVLIFDEPTRGIDVGAKAEIYRLIQQLAAQGAGIIMISSELPEVLLMSDSVIVMRDGRIVLRSTRAEATEQRIGQALLGTDERVHADELLDRLGPVPAASGEYRIGLVVKDRSRDHWRAMADGATHAAKRLGVTLVVTGGATETAQLDAATALLDEGVDAVAVSPLTVDNLSPFLTSMSEQKCPVVNVEDARVGTDHYIGADQRAAGRCAAQLLAATATAGPIAHIGGPATSPAARQRADGLADGLTAYPDLELVAIVEASWRHDTARDATHDLLRAHPDLVGIYAANDTMALGVVEALEDADHGEAIAVVGTDGVDAARAAVNSGRMVGTVATYPERMGALAVEVLVRRLEGQSVPSEILSWQDPFSGDHESTGAPGADRAGHVLPQGLDGTERQDDQ